MRKRLGVYDHMGTALGESRLTRGNFTKVLAAYQDDLKPGKKHLGEGPDTAANFNEIGRVYLQRGDYVSAKEAFDKVRDTNSKLCDEWNTAGNCHNLALTYYELESYPDLVSARAFCQEALALWQKFGDHEEKRNITHTLGIIHYKMGEFLTAIKALQEASRLSKETLGYHSLTAARFNLLGCLHYDLGDYNSAVEALQEASRIRSTVLGDHKDTAKSYHWLGAAQCDLGDLNGARESLQTAS